MSARFAKRTNRIKPAFRVLFLPPTVCIAAPTKLKTVPTPCLAPEIGINVGGCELLLRRNDVGDRLGQQVP